MILKAILRVRRKYCFVVFVLVRIVGVLVEIDVYILCMDVGNIQRNANEYLIKEDALFSKIL